jgi:hypothetical protein
MNKINIVKKLHFHWGVVKKRADNFSQIAKMLCVCNFPALLLQNSFDAHEWTKWHLTHAMDYIGWSWSWHINGFCCRATRLQVTKTFTTVHKLSADFHFTLRCINCLVCRRCSHLIGGLTLWRNLIETFCINADNNRSIVNRNHSTFQFKAFSSKIKTKTFKMMSKVVVSSA